ncbi:MAG: DUF167 domain-containing protein [Candidatus Margulisbacteria bacterium]|nr:DUF167 domain-containing protein [Candidatus Margulisiibacteriota bacterium]
MIVNVKVVPNAKRNKIIEENGKLKVYLNAPAVDGKANQALLEFMAEHYGVKRRQVTIIRGERNREKVVEVKAI